VCKGEEERYIYVINSLILFLYIGTGLPVEKEEDSGGHFMAYFITFTIVCGIKHQHSNQIIRLTTISIIKYLPSVYCDI
jgi:hypothetical protein